MKMLCRDVHQIRRYQGNGGINTWGGGQKTMDQVNHMGDGQSYYDPHNGYQYKIAPGLPQRKLTREDSCQCKPEYDQARGIVDQAFPFQNGRDTLRNFQVLQYAGGCNGVGW